MGWYDPHANPTKITVKGDRVQYWLGKGAKSSATVHNLLVTAGVIKAEKVVKAHAKKEKVDPAAVVKKAEAPKEEAKAEIPKVAEKPVEAPKAEAKKEDAPAA